MTELTFAFVVGIPVILAIVEVIKKNIPAVPSVAYPLVSILVAIALQFGADAAELSGFDPEAGPIALIIAGIIAGLSASGLYSAGDTAVKKAAV